MFNFGRMKNSGFVLNFIYFLFRIICRLEYGSNIARCIAIRVAGQDEWHERRAVIKHCDIQLNQDDLNSKKFKKNKKKSQK